MKQQKTKVVLKTYVLVMLCVFSLMSFKIAIENTVDKSAENKGIIGKWKVTNAEILPFDHISYCKNLNVNAIFEFAKNSILKVYHSPTDKKNCNEDQTYRIENNKIVILEHDMIFIYEIVSQSDTKLIIKTTNIPNDFYQNNKLSKKDFDTIINNGFKIYLSKVH